jgi:hypothetical protein
MLAMKDVLDSFWDWRMGSVCVEVDWFSNQAGAPTAARVSLDGLVTQVDSAGIVTVSGEGREIELDLRRSSFRRPRETFARGALDSLDPETILEIDFPSGDVCLIFPYRRVAVTRPATGQILHGLQWSKNDLSLLANHAASSEESAEPKQEEPAAEQRKPARPPKIVKIRPPLMPVVSVMLTVAVILLVIIPLQVPQRLIQQLDFHTARMTSPSTRVWVMPSKGTYYCSGSMMNGRQPGHFLGQAEALSRGYQPAMGSYCTSGKPGDGGAGGSLQPGPFFTLQQRGAQVLAKLAELPHLLLSQFHSRAEMPDKFTPAAPR